jgi:hypothetical protein
MRGRPGIDARVEARGRPDVGRTSAFALDRPAVLA